MVKPFNLAVAKLNMLHEKTPSKRVIRAISTLQQNIRYKSWINKADAVADPDDYITFANEILPQFQSAPETKVVLLKKKKYITEFTIYGNSNQGQFYTFLKQFFEGATGEDTFIPKLLNADQILFFKSKKVQGVNLKQVFKDNHASNCVFVPIRNTINEILETDISKPTKRKYQQMLDQLNQEEANYPDGVPQDEIIPLSKRLNFRVELTDIMGQTFLENGSKNSKAKVKLVNTRMNHVDNYTDEKTTDITPAQMRQIYNHLRKTNQFYLIYNNTDEIKTIKTLDGTFKVEDPDQHHYDEMNKQIKSSGIDALQYPELNYFLKEGRIINSYVYKIKEFTPNVKCFDMKNAYTKYAEAPNYEGFPYIIHQFRPTDKIVNIGIYEFVINTSTPLSRLFGLFTDNKYILPSPEIKWWMEHGVDLDIIHGAWGSNIDIEMTPEFIEKKLYNKWIGKLSASDNFHYTKHTFPASNEFVQNVASVYPHTFYSDFKKEAQVKIPNKHIMTKHHIHAFFPSYARLNMLNVLKDIPIDEIYGVELDSIFTTHNINHYLFREKPRTFTTQTFYKKYWYNNIDTEYTPPPPIHELITENSLLSGQGGTGKTFSILEDKGYINPLYIVPTHELGKRSNRNYETIHKLIGLGTSALHTKYVPSVILLDEITMYDEKWIHETFKQYPHSLILLAGDMDKTQHYQCRGGSMIQYTPIYKPTINIVNYEHDYRSKTEELKQMKLELRKFMQTIYTDGGLQDTHKIRLYLKQNYKHISIQEAKKLATEDDIFLWGTHKTEKLLEGYNSKGVHAFQGQTIDQPSKIFIVNDWFEYAMPYTALSRATHHEQIYFVST